MVEVNIEFLAGVAVTVFLALLFFGVVVLWDVALALRSVGDKIDKLEDNLDDDLTEIGHSLDGVSNVTGGDGGTQLHLNGGTISSGAGTGGQHGGQPAGAPQGGAAAHVQYPGQTPGPHQHDAADARTAGPGAVDAGPAAGGDRARAHPDEPTVDERDSPDDAAEVEPEDDRTEADDGTETDVAADDESVGDESGGDDSENEPHPRAARNRGRFITSPDATAWYATPLDRDAIRNPGPEIAGVLESSDAADDVFAAGPGEPDEDDEQTEEPVVAAPPADGTTDDSTDPQSETNGDEPDGSEPATSLGDSTGSPPETPTGGETSSTDTSDEESATDGEDEAVTGTQLSFGQGASDDGEEAGGSSGATDESEPAGSDGEPVGSAADDEPAVRGEVTADGIEIEGDDVDGLGDASVPETGDKRPTGDEVAERTGGAVDGTDSAAGDDETTDDGGAVDSDGAANGDEAAEFTGFELEDVSDLGDADDVSVDEAVETMNDEAPALSLSSHDFDVTAEADEESATLVFEFDPATVELTGSTRRLLRYQLSSFAERSDTPDGEITIEGQTLVIELPATDGGAVQRWGEAAVNVIDRTLYLSDDSE